MNIYLLNDYFEKESEKIKSARVNPTDPINYALFFIEPQRLELTDLVTGVNGYGHRLIRKVSQYQKLTHKKDLLLIEIPHLSSRQQRSTSLVLSSDVFEPEEIESAPYKIKRKNIPDHVLVNRPDLIEMPSAELNSPWSIKDRSSLFIGKNQNNPTEGNYVINYICSVFPSFIVVGALDDSGEISPSLVFDSAYLLSQDNPLLAVRNFLHLRAQRVHEILIDCHIFSIITVGLIILREALDPLKYGSIWRTFSRTHRYDIFLSPLVLFIPQTHTWAFIFCSVIFAYAWMRFLLTRALELIKDERVNLYG